MENQDPIQMLLQQIAAQNQQLLQMQEFLATAQQAPTLNTPELAPQGIARHLDKPKAFDGKDRAACSTFIASVRQYIRACPDNHFPTEDTKIDFVISYLHDDAFRWVEPYLQIRDNPESPTPMFASMTAFLEALLKAKGDPDIKATYTRRLYNLRQTSSASAYATEFFRISAYLGWDDTALRSQFEYGLKGEIKDALALRDSDPATVQELAEVAIRLDNRLYARKEESKGRATPLRQAPSRAHAPPAHPPARDPQAMDLDASTSKRFKPLTYQEKQRRRDNNLCMYCGEPGHRAADCPKKYQPRTSSAKIHAVLVGEPDDAPAEEEEDTEAKN